MKKIILIVIPVLTALYSCAQDVQQSLVPSVIVNSFQQKFPKASDVEWEKRGDVYEVEFDLGTKDHKALIDTTGKIVKHKEEINPTILPDAVKSTIVKEFNKYQVDEAKRIETDGLVIYKVELENGSEEKKIYFGEDGKIIEVKPSFD